MNKLKLLIKWMSTRMKDTTFELSAEYLIALTYEDFNVFRQKYMIRMHSSKQRLTRAQFHFHDNYPSPDNPPQDVDKLCHLSDSSSTTQVH